MAIDKRHFIQQLRQAFEAQLDTARKAAGDPQEAAATLATESEKKEDGRADDRVW